MQVTINISVPNPTRGCSSIHFCTEHDEILSPTQARVQETPWSFSLTASKLPYAEGSPPPIRVGMAVPALGRRSAFLDRSSSGKWESAKMGAIIFFCFARPRGRNSPGRRFTPPPRRGAPLIRFPSPLHISQFATWWHGQPVPVLTCKQSKDAENKFYSSSPCLVMVIRVY